jgi:branched-subunit amino acid ABC-type transport system permease component
MRVAAPATARPGLGTPTLSYVLIGLMIALGVAAPFAVYPIFLMKALCFALFACAFNLLLGYVGLLSFGHAAFLGWAAYVTGYTVTVWGLSPELAILAGTENPTLVRAFGINVPVMMTLTYGFGVALAAFAGVLAAPIYQVNPLMGSDLIIVVFAIVVIGGMGSILGSIVTGLGLGIVEGLTKVFYAEASSTVIFVIMAIVLLIRPAGLFGRTS